VIFGTTPVDEAFNTAADEIRTLVGGS